MKLFNREPALFLGVVQAVLALLLAFGVDLTAEQVGCIMAASAAVLSLVVRAKVSPTNGGNDGP